MVEVRVSPCDGEPCVFLPGTTGQIEIDFLPTNLTSRLQAELTANLLGSIVKWPGVHRDACNERYNLECPLTAGQLQTYRYKFHIAKLTPRLTTQLTWKLMNESNIVVCFQIVIKIL